jgi:hypothetical protein
MAVDEAAFYSAVLGAGVGNDFYTWSEGVVDVDIKLFLTAASHRKQSIRVTFDDGHVVEGVPRSAGGHWTIASDDLSLVNVFADEVATVIAVSRKPELDNNADPAPFEQRQRLSDLAERL